MFIFSSDLTRRDLLHLMAWTSEVAPLADNEHTWYKNGRGLWVSNDFGFGLLNAENLVIAAKQWTPVPKECSCGATIKPRRVLTIITFQCHQEIRYNNKVQVKLFIPLIY